MQTYFKIAFLFAAPFVLLISLFLAVGAAGLIYRPYVKIDHAYWTDDGSALVVNARTVRCDLCGNVEINGMLDKRIIPNRDDGSFTVTIPKEKLDGDFVKIDAYSEAAYFGGHIRSGRMRIPDANL